MLPARYDDDDDILNTDHKILTRIPDLKSINEKKRASRLQHFAVSVDHEVKIKESETINK